MTKLQLIEKVAGKTELAKAEAEVAVDSVLQVIAEALKSNKQGRSARAVTLAQGRQSPLRQNGMQTSGLARN